MPNPTAWAWRETARTTVLPESIVSEHDRWLSDSNDLSTEIERRPERGGRASGRSSAVAWKDSTRLAVGSAVAGPSSG